jgi:hypothetical protein
MDESIMCSSVDPPLVIATYVILVLGEESQSCAAIVKIISDDFANLQPVTNEPQKGFCLPITALTIEQFRVDIGWPIAIAFRT